MNVYPKMIQKNKLFILVLALLCILNMALLYQCGQLRRIVSKEQASRQRTEWVFYDGIKNVGKTIPLDSISAGHHFVLRYDATSCITCVLEAEALLESVFGRETILEELCLIGVPEVPSPFANCKATTYEGCLTPLDEVYSPYFCYINNNGEVVFSLTLQPDNYDYNYKILHRLKRALGIEESK